MYASIIYLLKQTNTTTHTNAAEATFREGREKGKAVKTQTHEHRVNIVIMQLKMNDDLYLTRQPKRYAY